MIVMQGIEDGSNGSNGFRVLGQAGTTYNCGAKICWGIGKDNHANMVALQAALNRFASEYGFAPIATDGFIGEKTVAAAQKVAPRLSVATDMVLMSSKETLAANAGYLTKTLLSIAAAENKPPVAAPTTAAVKDAQTKQEQAQAIQQQQIPKPAGDHSWIWWLVGGVAVVGIGTIGYMTWKKRKEEGGGEELAPEMYGPRRYYGPRRAGRMGRRYYGMAGVGYPRRFPRGRGYRPHRFAPR